jgi:hypothetical protein
MSDLTGIHQARLPQHFEGRAGLQACCLSSAPLQQTVVPLLASCRLLLLLLLLLLLGRLCGTAPSLPVGRQLCTLGALLTH